MAFTRSVPPALKKELLLAQERKEAAEPKSKPKSPSDTPLTSDFLRGPIPKIDIKKVDFKAAGLSEHEDAWAVILDGVLSQKECDSLLEAAEATTDGVWERAMVNVGGGMQAMYEDTRKCGRIIWDNREVMERLWARVGPSVEEIHALKNWPYVTGNGPAKRGETWKVTRLNERGRYLKYIGGEYFKPHCDGTYETPDRTERSYFTLHLYLNDAEDKDGQQLIQGGATTFFSWTMQERLDVVPKAGRVLLFQHQDLLHSGDDLISGTKYTLRTDVMYALERQKATEQEAQA